MINIFITFIFFSTFLYHRRAIIEHASFEHLADNVALETQQSTSAADKSSLRAVQSIDGDRHLWEVVRDRDGPKQHYPRHRRESW